MHASTPSIGLPDERLARHTDIFGGPATGWALSPGRIEVIGNHTDYNGGTVVGAAIDRHISVTASMRSDGRIRLFSDSLGDEIIDTTVTSYTEDSLPEWTAYLLGVIDEFRLRGWMLDGVGCDLHVSSDLPTGNGLSSSAALELGTAGVLSALLFGPDEQPGVPALIEVAHRAENRYVGVPCGKLDQTVVARGRDGHLVVLDAATDRHVVVPLPEGHHFVLFRSHITHRLVDSPYETRHRECREALMALERMIPGIRHLARCHPADLEAYGVVMEERIARRASHVIHEQRRVGRFLRALSEQDPESAGATMSASHESSRTLFENSTPELDALVQLASNQTHVKGARLSGGGWGGSVLALVGDRFEEASAEAVCDAYEELFEARPHWWRTRATHGLRSGRI